MEVWYKRCPVNHRGRVEDASDELEVRLALLNNAVDISGSNAELAESAYPLGFEAINHLLDVKLLQQRERACVVIARDLEADELFDTSSRDLASEALAVGCCKPVEEDFAFLGVGDGEVIDPDGEEEKRADALEGEDARFAPNTA
eukprot:5065353-Pleurochrysis_carterae.AAC.4